jgi:hypothetical protein
VEVITRTKLYVDHLDAYLMQQRSLVHKRKKTALPVLLQRQVLADSLAKHLSLLGLERRTKPIQTLGDYVASRYSNDGAHTSRESVTEREEDSS